MRRRERILMSAQSKLSIFEPLGFLTCCLCKENSKEREREREEEEKGERGIGGRGGRRGR